MKNHILIIFLTLIILYLSGCGETVHGVGKDASRITNGVKTIFFRPAVK